MTPWTAVCQASLSFTVSWILLKFMSIESVMPCNHLILCCPLLLLPSIIPSIRVFANESVLHIRWPKYWNFNFHISPSNEYSELISFRMDWFDLLAVQRSYIEMLIRTQHRMKRWVTSERKIFRETSHQKVLRGEKSLWWSGFQTSVCKIHLETCYSTMAGADSLESGERPSSLQCHHHLERILSG